MTVINIHIHTNAPRQDKGNDSVEGQAPYSDFIDNCLEREENAIATSSQLVAAWESHAAQNGLPVGTRKGLMQAMHNAGFIPHHTGRQRGFTGVVIKNISTDKTLQETSLSFIGDFKTQVGASTAPDEASTP